MQTAYGIAFNDFRSPRDPKPKAFDTDRMDVQNRDDLKKAAADVAVRELKDGMVIGLGSGSTARFVVAAIGQRVRDGLRVVGVPTSETTAKQAQSLGIPLTDLGEHAEIDITIDGADEVDPQTLDLIKGGGGNLLREKIVAASGKRLIIVVDHTKITSQLRGPVPVEITQFGWQSTVRRLAALGSNPVVRVDSQGKQFVTDGGNLIIDCGFETIKSVAELQAQLDATVGVVEHGLFLGFASQVVIGAPEGVRVLSLRSTK
jgi:ribose 5-phosphate isomerase A